ncbi:MAG: leukotriene A4 hydrolase C-terminal domain-containing protein [Steroidobacterales bacterium]
MRRAPRALSALMLLCSAMWAGRAGATAMPGDAFAGLDSYANIDQFRTSHIDLALDVDFDSRQLLGVAVLELQRLDPRASQLVLDTKDLTVLGVTELTSDILGATSTPTPIWISRPFHLGKADPILGSPLVVDLPVSKQEKLTIRIEYETAPNARGLHWRVPTVRFPRQPLFLYTLSAPINARSWIPLQDTPRVRATYRAHVHTPANLVALMAASADAKANHNGDTWFQMTRPVPAQAFALCVGDLRFKATGPRTGVYAEGAVVSAAAREFGDTEAMLQAAEKLLGAYPWQRFDVAVMPMSFPVTDAEGPDLVLVSPTLVAGDKSLVAPIAYALAYSWSGNLVTNTDWRDRWLGEAIAGHFARRMLADVYGEGRDAQAPGQSGDAVLAADLQERAYDDIFDEAQRYKGQLLFSWLEARAGRTRLEGLLRAFLERFAGQSVSTGQFVAYLQENLIDRNPGLLTESELSAWIYGTGIPPDAAPRTPQSVAAAVAAVTSADIKVLLPQARQWSPVHWLEVLDAVPGSIGAARLAELDRGLALSASSNAEIAAGWFALTLRAGFRPALVPLEKYLLTTGRLTLVEPLYEQLMQSEDGVIVARRVYALARAGYHPFVARRLDEIVKP